MKTKLLILFTLFFSFSLFAETLEVETITEALAYTGNKEAITKLVVTGTIAGNDYSDGSEWREFRTLDETFPNIEAVEIWTSQDIPDVDVEYKENGYTIHALRCLFYCEEHDTTIYQYVNKSAMWIKHFSAPNVKYIGEMAFGMSGIESVSFPSAIEIGPHAFTYCDYITHIKEEDFPSLTELGGAMFKGCYGLISARFTKAEIIGGQAFYLCFNLTEIYFPEVKAVYSMAFASCINLLSIDFPKVTLLDGYGAFSSCYSLISVSFGSGFEEETEIEFGSSVFVNGGATNINEDTLTRNMNLTLSNFVLPKPNGNYWNYNIGWIGGNNYDTSLYEWKIVKVVGIDEEIEDTPIYYLGNNIYHIDNDEFSDVELYDISGKKVRSFGNEIIIDLNDLPVGTYFLKYTLNNKTRIEKIIRY